MNEGSYYILVYNTFFICAIVFALLINTLFLRFAKTMGIRNNNDGTIIRWGTQSKPAFGGISFYIVFLLTITAYSFFFNPNQVMLNKEFVALLLSVTIGFLMGLADDAYNTQPILKFSAQVLCGVVLILGDIYINISPYPLLNYAITIIWIVGIMNSLNMLDNMDGITTSVSLVIIMTIMAMVILNKDFGNLHFLILTGTMASLLAFLFYNWHPSQMYMGDTGSQFLGILLGALSIIFLWNDHYAVGTLATTKQFMLIMLAFIMPLVDTMIVVINRLSRGQSPFVGGKDHTTHSLAMLGFSDRQVAMVFIGISLLSGMIVVYIQRFILEWTFLHFWVLLIYFLIVFSVFFYITKHRKLKV